MHRSRAKVRTLAAALAILSAGPVAVHAEPPDKACAAAEVALPAANPDGPPPLFSDPGPGHGRALSDEDLRAGWSGRTPGLSTVRNFRRAPARSALACAGVDRLARRRGEVTTLARGRARLDAMGLVPGRTAYLHSLSLPVFDDAGREALVEVRSSSNHLFGGVDLLLLARRDGRWAVVGRKALLMG